MRGQVPGPSWKFVSSRCNTSNLCLKSTSFEGWRLDLNIDYRKVDRLHRKGNSKLPWRKAGQPSHLVDVVDSEQQSIKNSLSLNVDCEDRYRAAEATACQYGSPQDMRCNQTNARFRVSEFGFVVSGSGYGYWVFCTCPFPVCVARCAVLSPDLCGNTYNS